MNYNLNNKGLNEAVRELSYRVYKLENSMSTPAPDNYMVTVEDLMARLKSREERIEALKQENNKLESENDRLEKENEELKEALNIYQDNTVFEVTMFTDVAFLRLYDSDAAGRTVVKGKDRDTLCNA